MWLRHPTVLELLTSKTPNRHQHQDKKLKVNQTNSPRCQSRTGRWLLRSSDLVTASRTPYIYVLFCYTAQITIALFWFIFTISFTSSKNDNNVSPLLDWLHVQNKQTNNGVFSWLTPCPKQTDQRWGNSEHKELISQETFQFCDRLMGPQQSKWLGQKRSRATSSENRSWFACVAYNEPMVNFGCM